MKRFLLVHEGQRILLQEGETLIGRSLACGIRFNDAAVSREHLRIYVSKGMAAVANLSANGTLLNGARMVGPRQLREGDQLNLGYRRIQVAAIEEHLPAPASHRSWTTELDESLAEEVTYSGEDEWPWEEPKPGDPPLIDEQPISLVQRLQRVDVSVHICPRCRAEVSYFDDTCPRCAYVWPGEHPSSVTQKIVIEQIRVRKDPRYPVEVPVIYSSADLTIDAMVRDVSRGGMFIATEILDTAGTACELTALPDGYPPVRFTGTVAHVTTDRIAGRVGLGIQFTDVSPVAQEWLEQVMAGYGVVPND